MPTRTQGGYSFHMAVDPASPGDGVNDIIYFGTVSQAKSTNSGGSFSTLAFSTRIRTRGHSFFSLPSHRSCSVVMMGALTRSVGGATWNPLDSGGLQTGLFFNIDVKPDATASVVVGGAQDNGLQTTAGAVSPNWISQGADGYGIAYDGVTPKRVYGSSGYWSGSPPVPCTRCFARTTTELLFHWPTTLHPGPPRPTRAATLPRSPRTRATQTPFMSVAARICGKAKTAALPGGNYPLSRAPAISDVAAADGNNVAIAVGAQVFVSTNALAATVTFTNITRNLPGRNVARVVFDPIDPTVIYAVLGGLNGIGPGQSGHVFRTTVTASSWTDISPTVGNPPVQVDIPCNAIALDGTDVPTTIYVGTDLGVICSVDIGASWTVLDDIHFPLVPVLDLVLNQNCRRAVRWHLWPRRIQIYQAGRPGGRRQSGRQPKLRHGLRRAGLSDAGSL